MKRLILVPLAAILAFGLLSGCTNSVKPLQANGNSDSQEPQSSDIGSPLYRPAPVPQPPAHAGFSVEPMLVHSHVAIVDKVDIPSQKDTRIIFIGTELKPGEQLADPSKLYRHRDKLYRPLEPGIHVAKDQLVMILDDRQAYAELELRRAAAQTGQEIYEKATEMHKAQLSAYQQKQKLYMPAAGGTGQLSELEWVMAIIEYKRSEATLTSTKADMIQKNQEYEKAKVDYEMYFIRSSIDGYIQPFKCKIGESIKALETLLQVQSTDRLRAEGQVSAGFANRLEPGMPVIVEPSMEVSPNSRRRFHTQGVNGVAVSNHARPYIVSVSDDKSARVWDGRSDFETAIFTHPVGVRCVACSPKGSRYYYCLTGADDGKLRLWDLTNPKSSSTPLREFDGFAHKSVIASVAFSPDGKWCASADSRDIVLWDVESGTKKYQFPQAHLGEITSLTFTPQCKLVSASRDLTVRVWSLGDNGASLDFTQEGRSGEVARLGVSNDGRYFLFDIAQSLRLMTIPDRRTEGWLEGADDSYKFASFAVFSNDNKMILTGSQSDGRLSVWRAPTAGVRATEVRQFKPSQRMVSFTCAAISPRDDNPIAVTGTKSGEIYVWPMPTDKDALRIRGTLMFVDQNASATQQVRIWADFDNRVAKVRPGDAVTLVIEPPSK